MLIMLGLGAGSSLQNTFWDAEGILESGSAELDDAGSWGLWQALSKLHSGMG